MVMFVRHILGGRRSALESNNALIHTTLSLGQIKPLVLLAKAWNTKEMEVTLLNFSTSVYIWEGQKKKSLKCNHFSKKT